MANNGRNRNEGIAEGADSDELIEALASFHDDPLGFVMFAFPWGEEGTALAAKPLPVRSRIGHNGGPIMDEPGPDIWQIEFLAELGDQIKARRANPDLGSIRMGRVSGHGVGKLFGYETIVPTPSGHRRWGDVKPGDELVIRDLQDKTAKK